MDIVLFGFFFLLSATNLNAQRNYRHDCKEGEIVSFDNSGKTCSCINGRWACDYTSTSTSTTSAPVTNCVPDENVDYTDYCGCFCLNGWWACADCFPTESTSSTESSTIDNLCQDGDVTSFDGCNNCTCVNGVWGCTKIFCQTSTVEPPRKCKPGSSKIEDCNRCYCTETSIWVCSKVASC